MERREFLKYSGVAAIGASVPPIFLATEAHALINLSMLRIVGSIVGSWLGSKLLGGSAEASTIINDHSQQFNTINNNLAKENFTENPGYFEVDRLPGKSAHKPGLPQTHCFGIATRSGKPSMLEAGSLVGMYDFLGKHNKQLSRSYLKEVTRPINAGRMPKGDILSGYSIPTQYDTAAGSNIFDWKVWRDGKRVVGQGRYRIVDNKRRHRFEGSTPQLYF